MNLIVLVPEFTNLLCIRAMSTPICGRFDEYLAMLAIHKQTFPYLNQIKCEKVSYNKYTFREQ